MKNFLDTLLRYSNLFYRALLFVLSIGVIVYFLPREGKFKYEFQQGAPWMHEDLSAPFNLPVYKSQTEIDEQKDSIKKTLLQIR